MIRARAARALPPVLLVCALLGAWELYVQASDTSAFVLPAPHSVAAS